MKHFPQPATTSMEYGAPPRSFVADFRAALLNTPYQGISVAKVKPKFRTRIRYLAVLWTVGVVLMISATWLMVWLAIFNHPETAILVYLLIITLLSSMDSFLTSVVFSVIAVVCLSYFFKEPRYSFEVAGAQDLIALFTFVGTSLAIATLVRRARQFGEAQHEQATLLELTPDAIFALDTHRVITYWNRGAERLFGWSKDEAIGKPAHLLLKAVYPTPFHEIGEKSNRTGQWEGDLIRTTREFTHAARVSTLGELTASIAHELNQPLGAIAVNCEASLRWLDRPKPNLDEVHELTRRSLADARRAADIIHRVRGMAARRAPERLLVPLHDVILEALQFLRHEAEWRSITVSHMFSAPSSDVLADRTLLQQLIVNLAVNAMQAMAQVDTAERRITVRTTSPDETTLRCSVEDSGPGIEPEHLARLFESFFTTKQGGMGMGLSVCRSITEAHGGRIEADNDSIHGGARFSFTLPAANQTLQ